jgi:hypothetical protein
MTTDQRIENLEKGLASARRLNRWLLAAVGLALGVWILAGTFGPTMAAAPAGGAAVKVIRANSFVVEDENGKVQVVLAAVGLALGVWILAGTLGPATAGAPGGGAAAKVIRANSFVVEDENGKVQVVLAATKDGPRLGLYDESGKGRVTIDATKDGAVLRLCDENGKGRVMLAALKDGPTLNLFDENGKTRAMLNTSKDGPGLTLYDESGKGRVTIDATKDGAVLRLCDENGKGRAMLAAFKDGAGLSLFNENGATIWHAP